MKLYKSLLGLALAAVVSAGFTSCENDFDYPPVIMPEIEGNGSPASPYDVQTVLLKIYQGQYQSWRDYYVKGVVSRIDYSQDFNPTYGNITYWISDNGEAENEFEIYRGLGLNGEKFTSFGDLKVGDEVVVACKLTYYNNSVAETTQGATLVSLNGSDYEKVNFPEPEGNGSAAQPYNVMGMLQYTFSDELNPDKEVYVEGVVTRVDASSFNASYGNLNYYISDTGTAANEYYIYRGLGLNGAKFTSADALKPGTKVVVKGKSTLYNSSVAETSQGAVIVSIDGSDYDKPEPDPDPTPGEGGEKAEPTGNGTAASPYNISKALDVIATLGADTASEEVYLTGIVCELGEFSDSYGNYSYKLSDDGKTGDYALLVYRGKYFNGEKFTSASQLKVGDVVVLSGTIVNFKGNTPEVNSGSKIVSINGETSGTTPEPTPEPTPGDAGTKEKPYTVADLLGGTLSGNAWVEGYIVGSVNGKSLADDAKFGATDAANTNILIAATAGETTAANCVPVQLPAGDIRAALNIVDHPEFVGKKVKIYGSLEKYFGVLGVKTVTEYEIDGQSGGVTPTPDPTPSGDTIYAGLVDNMDGWNVQNVTIPEGLADIWTWKVYNNSGYLNASAYQSSGATDSEAYAYTTVDLTGATTATLTFDHAAKFQTTLTSLCGLVVRVQGTTAWTALTIPTWPTAGAWTFANSGAIDLKAYAGKKIEIGFKYGSSSAGADTWEIKNFTIVK